MAKNQIQEEDHSSSPSKSDKDKKKKENSDNAKVSAPPPKSNDSNSDKKSESKSPSLSSPPPPSKKLSKSPPSPPPPSSKSQPVTHKGGSSPPPPYHRKQSSPPRPPPQRIKPSNGKHGVASGAADSKNSSTSSSPVTSSSGSDDNGGKYVSYTLAGIFAIALVALAVALIFTVKKKKSRVDLYATPLYLPALNIHVKSGVNGHYYLQQPTQSPSLAKNLGNRNASMLRLGTAFESPTCTSAQIVFTFEMVMEMTNAFSSQNVIGEGGFGCVYKGCLPDGKAVAVKQLKAGSEQGEREFKSEVEIISRVHHRHLVSLVGYCIFEHQRILIYEYVPNGTLHHQLHGSGMPVLDWVKRLKIAIGAAKGLAYLHEDCSQKIIHRDIKSANILLDHAYEAQVADFGLARLTDAATSHVSTRVMGTFGYMAPEYATSGKLTDRSDVYSFGVVLLELVTGRKPVDQTQPLGDESLVEWARPLLLRAIETRNFSDLIDPRLEKHFVESEMLRMIEAAAACVRHSAPKRPRMVQVVRALDCGNESDLSNGVKYGHSTVYDSGQYDKEIMLFKRLANGTFVESDFDMLSRENSLSRDISMTSRGSQQELIPHSSSGESESRSITREGASSIG